MILNEDMIMRRTLRLVPVAAILVAGCVAATRDRIGADYPNEKAGIERRLHEIFDAAKKKDMDRLDSYHLYGPSLLSSPRKPSAGSMPWRPARGSTTDWLLSVICRCGRKT